jgi:hypothetical protein
MQKPPISRGPIIFAGVRFFSELDKKEKKLTDTGFLVGLSGGLDFKQQLLLSSQN